jgi:hypothetical protein
MRNALEHLDARVDTWANSSKSHHLALHLIIDDNSLRNLDPGDMFTRYNPTKRTVAMLAHTVDLTLLEKSVTNVLDLTEAAISRIWPATARRRSRT